ncbi:uncharacterized protein LOC127810634 [Diospyros lotus]|uniref:uncharacterized protein LOC127810634 n=1 Tax=Diospyros lotus TaxID=55363 RepID=UPI002252F253|nr:uncharacterized protein LOC127810634 [Diospyros lotus]
MKFYLRGVAYLVQKENNVRETTQRKKERHKRRRRRKEMKGVMMEATNEDGGDRDGVGGDNRDVSDIRGDDHDGDGVSDGNEVATVTDGNGRGDRRRWRQQRWSWRRLSWRRWKW